MPSHRTLVVALSCLLVGGLVGAVVPAAAAPPPRPLCDACGEPFEATAESQGVSLSVDRSTATITVHGNGTATWTVHNHLASDATADRLRANHTLLTEITENAMWDAEFLAATVSDDGVVTMRYRDPGFASRSVGGVLRSGAFTERFGYGTIAGLGADRLTVVAPEGTHVGRTVPGASVSDDGGRMTLTAYTDGRIVTFVPRTAVLGPLLGLVAVATLLGPVLLVNALAYVVLPTAVFALLVAGIAGVLPSPPRNSDLVRERPGSSLAATGLLVTALSVFAADGLALLGRSTLPLFGTGIAFVALGVLCSRGSVRERLTYRRLVGVAVVGTAVATAVTVAGTAAVGRDALTHSLVTGLPFLVPAFALLPAGYALGRGNRRLAVGTAAVGFGVSMLPFVPYTTPPVGIGSLRMLLVTGYAAIVSIIGVPLLVVGSAFPTRESGS